MGKNILKEIIINKEWCKGCGICVHFCPKEVLALDDNDKSSVKNPEKCSVCRLCELRCPDLAIEVRGEAQSGDDDSTEEK